ncbi:hypothetical protein SAMN04487948_11773 [Halogranum amylolyticum]|uniref:Uncharacterized protein n=1 Tax=Halogranum amylolyticum TaxID=660520 RepID=A0A1H8VKP6_9EURY|nr:hypothetical protein SAMN04487948_11773 [Halogranum amylolyticum]
MTGGLDPTETTDKRITVLVLHDAERRRIDCMSYEEAISVVKAEQSADNVVKIETREGEIVFTSGEMDIEDWETEWRREKRRLSMDVEVYDCPHESVGCVADDLCVQCKMDKIQGGFV